MNAGFYEGMLVFSLWEKKDHPEIFYNILSWQMSLFKKIFLYYNMNNIFFPKWLGYFIDVVL